MRGQAPPPIVGRRGLGVAVIMRFWSQNGKNQAEGPIAAKPTGLENSARVMVAGALILGVAGVSGLSVLSAGSAPTGNASTDQETLVDKESALQLVEGRSPGVRGEAALSKQKKASSADAKASPDRRASRSIPRRVAETMPPSAPPLVLPFDMASIIAPQNDLQQGLAAIGSGDLLPVAIGGASGGGAGPAIVNLVSPPGAGGGAAPGGGIAPDVVPPLVANETPVPVPQVPEPAVWVTMLLGFGLIGGMMRRRPPGRGLFAFAARAKVAPIARP